MSETKNKLEWEHRVIDMGDIWLSPPYEINVEAFGEFSTYCDEGHTRFGESHPTLAAAQAACEQHAGQQKGEAGVPQFGGTDNRNRPAVVLTFGGEEVWDAENGTIELYRSRITALNDCLARAIAAATAELQRRFDEAKGTVVEQVNRIAELEGMNDGMRHRIADLERQLASKSQPAASKGPYSFDPKNGGVVLEGEPDAWPFSNAEAARTFAADMNFAHAQRTGGRLIDALGLAPEHQDIQTMRVQWDKDNTQDRFDGGQL